jgi:hypothetical protein
MFANSPPRPIPEDELVALLAAIIRQGCGYLARDADLYLATVSAQHIADRMALAGLVVVRDDRHAEL